jgi:hypothetical protein
MVDVVMDVLVNVIVPKAPSVAGTLFQGHNVRLVAGRSLRVDPSLSCCRTFLGGSGEAACEGHLDDEERRGGATLKGTTK